MTPLPPPLPLLPPAPVAVVALDLMRPGAGLERGRGRGGGGLVRVGVARRGLEGRAALRGAAGGGERMARPLYLASAHG